MNELQKPVSKVFTMADVLGMFRSNISQFRAKLTKVRDDLEKARRRREDLMTLPPPAEEVCDRLLAILDYRAENYRRQLMTRLHSLAGECAKPADSQGLQASTQLLQNLGQFSGQETEAMLAYMFRAQVRVGMLNAINAMGLKCGPALSARPAELQQLDTRIAELTIEEKSMLAELDKIQSEALR